MVTPNCSHRIKILTGKKWATDSTKNTLSFSKVDSCGHELACLLPCRVWRALSLEFCVHKRGKVSLLVIMAHLLRYCPSKARNTTQDSAFESQFLFFDSVSIRLDCLLYTMSHISQSTVNTITGQNCWDFILVNTSHSFEHNYLFYEHNVIKIHS